MSQWLLGIGTLVVVVGGGWLGAAAMFREVFGRYPWEPRGVPCGDPDGWADPEERCPRHPKDCVCWRLRRHD